jgi:hypothetical protein
MVQCATVGIDVEYYVATGTAVAPRRPTMGHILLPPKSDAAIPTVAALHVDLRLVIEHDGTRIPQTGGKSRGKRQS